ncbi:DNA polymerase III, alpha subunit, gram-positive type [Serpentinimonas maccroryi]|uniref:DNA-directed DNA polymerase n=1 Tax=Serpentinimonas maccroryi TaxID=1458426 RepID=A0A060NPI1_9BURK|nr:exonuclease domain-containing protein [Serpentinimonas maccroryi]BAO83687.1 DNA polymerase III, alpha subunit, gram-positive type [Serpentinimonas maccroryi]
MASHKPTDKRLWWLLGVAAAVSVLWLLFTLWLIGASLEADERATVWALVGERLLLVCLTWGAGMGVIAWGLKRWFEHWITPSVQLAEEAQVLLRTDVVRELRPKGNIETKELAKLFNQLVAQREELRHQMLAKVRAAARDIEQEKSRLAALMSELTQSVVVCNLDGRILLYNQRARMQFRALSPTPQLAGGAELIGLGRSIYAVFDRKLVAHALESVQQRLQRGAAQPTAQFVTSTRAGQLLRVQMTPVRSAPAEDAAGADASGFSPSQLAQPLRVAGFVLMLDNITREFEAEAVRERLVLGLTEGSRAALANMRAAVEMLDYPDLEPALRERFLAVVRDEVQALSARVQRSSSEAAAVFQSRWPLEDMLGSDLLSAAGRRIEETLGIALNQSEADPNLWLRIESFSIMQALLFLAARLRDEFAIRHFSLRLRPSSQGADKAELDLIWSGATLSTETVMSWEIDPMRIGTEASALSVREVVDRHGGAFWLERDRASNQAWFRFLLPTAAAQEQLDGAHYVRSDSRPEFYDFDLFRVSPRSQALDDVPLVDLSFTVFDTETTGLNPAEGDEIIQIGAVRVLNGKLLKHECIDQLVDPRREIPPASIPIHGISPDMVAGQPDIFAVLPAFHTFAHDTVLVAHNAAFDMRFLQLKEQPTGLVFDHPVLDTLLLSAVVHPGQDTHRLEAIAERFGVQVIGRHTALGDAMVTAEIFVRLIPLLAEKGIHTLGQARAAAQQTFYARIKY